MICENFNFREHGFVGHLAGPDSGSDRAVIVIMGGEQSLLPGIRIAERFADYGIIGLAVSLFGADGIPDSPDRVPIDMFIPAVEYLRDKKHIEHISFYGQSMGSIFAVFAAAYTGAAENLILVSPTHVPFEGTSADQKKMSGRSVALWHGEDIPYVRADFSAVRTMKYQRHPAVPYRVMGMWAAYYDAYMDEAAVRKARLPIEKTNARILMIAGHEDEAWYSEYSAGQLKKYLEECGYPKEVKTMIFPHGSHLSGLMPNMDREKKLRRMIPLIGLMYRTFGKYRKENMGYLAQSEKAVIDWVKA